MASLIDGAQFQLERLADDVRFFKTMSQKQQAALNELKPQLEQAQALQRCVELRTQVRLRLTLRSDYAQLQSAHDTLHQDNESLRAQIGRMQAQLQSTRSTINPTMLSDLVPDPDGPPTSRPSADNAAKRRAVAEPAPSSRPSASPRPPQFSFDPAARAPTPSRTFALSASQAEHFKRPPAPRAASPACVALHHAARSDDLAGRSDSTLARCLTRARRHRRTLISARATPSPCPIGHRRACKCRRHRCRSDPNRCAHWPLKGTSNTRRIAAHRPPRRRQLASRLRGRICRLGARRLCPLSGPARPVRLVRLGAHSFPVRTNPLIALVDPVTAPSLAFRPSQGH